MIYIYLLIGIQVIICLCLFAWIMIMHRKVTGSKNGIIGIIDFSNDDDIDF